MSHHRETNPHFGARPPTPSHRPQVPPPTQGPRVPPPSHSQHGPLMPPHRPQAPTQTHSGHAPPIHAPSVPPPHSQQQGPPSPHSQQTPLTHGPRAPPPRSQQGQPPPHSQQGPTPLRVKRRDRTKALIWSAAVCCAIFWIIVILGGLIILVIYLVYRPQSPRFNVSSVTLNAAYLDLGYLLNADVTVLANFTNPNKKVRVDYSYMVIDLYYGDTPIATTAIEPFSATSLETIFVNLHMVSSQVRLSVKDSQRLAVQMQSNRVSFEIKGLFRTRSDLGGLLKYSYWLYGHCHVVVTGPPSGVLLASKCKTKR